MDSLNQIIADSQAILDTAGVTVEPTPAPEETASSEGGE